MNKNKKSQAVVAYAALIAFVAAALIAMSVYLQRRIQGSYKQAGDSIGREEIKD